MIVNIEKELSKKIVKRLKNSVLSPMSRAIEEMRLDIDLDGIDMDSEIEEFSDTLAKKIIESVK